MDAIMGWWEKTVPNGIRSFKFPASDHLVSYSDTVLINSLTEEFEMKGSDTISVTQYHTK